MKRTISELKQWQGLPLNIKVAMTKQRIRDWVREFGLDGVYISFSGGKDSTVLLHIAREMYGNEIKAVFSDTGLEYPEIRRFVKGFDNVDWVRPEMPFKQVIDVYGFPIISKEMSGIIGGGQNALRILESEGVDVGNKTEVVEQCKRRFKKEPGEWRRLAMCLSAVTKDNEIKADITRQEMGRYSSIPQRWKPLLYAPFDVSDKCCKVMKKDPLHKYNKVSKRVPMTAQMAAESQLRERQWLRHGCNLYDSKTPISNPMAFWTEQDVLLYIKTNNIPIASVYGEIVVDSEKTEQIEGQMSIFDFMGEDEKEKFAPDRQPLKTTGCKRTGCVFCGFGCHMEKGESRFQRLKRTHPKHYKAMANIKNNGINYFEAIDWINEHNGKGEIIRY